MSDNLALDDVPTPPSVDDPGAHYADRVTVIAPTKGWTALNLGDIWEYRELLYFLTWRDVKVRYKQTVLGAAWAIIQPLFTMLVFTIFFGKLANMPSDGVPYPIFAYAGLLPWTFFSNSITNSGASLIGSTNLITKVYFPRMIIPGSAVLAGLVDFGIAFSILVVLMVYYRIALTWNVLLLPGLVVLTTLLAIGVGMWMAALNVKYRDIRYALPFGVQLLMFVTPIIYPSSMVSDQWRWLLWLNPLTGVIEGYRSALLGQPVHWVALGFSVVIAVGFLFFSSFEFRRMERNFADLI